MSMDVNAAIGQFVNEHGQIQLRPEITLAGMCEFIYQAEKAAGDVTRPCFTFWDFSESREGTTVTFTREEINTRIKAVAGRLQQVGTIGDRVAILANNSPEYMFGFMGALYAGLVPVPLYDPTEPGHADHLTAVLADCQPKAVLTNSGSAGAVRAFFADTPGAERPRILAVDSLPDSLAEGFVNPLMTPQGQMMLAQRNTAPIDLTAFLQYTSGSTRTPAGVVLTNRSILTNILQIFISAQLQTPMRLVSWLPLHHDMGIILSAFVIILGLDLELMSPRDFIQQPSRWIQQLNRREGDNAVYSVIPNFALELSAQYAKPDEGAQLDLSAVDKLVVGSEPVTEKAVRSFLSVFSDFGLTESAMTPGYGLAEASLLVTLPQTEDNLVFNYFDRDDLAAGTATVVPAESPKAVSFASNGQVVHSQHLVIVDPETRAELPDGQIGEIWCYGRNMAVGYLDRPEDTVDTFRNELASRLPQGSRAEGAGEDNKWMATGDLGVIVDGHLYITGRLKDLIIIAGRNHYPQDIEYTVDHATDHVRPAAIAAFAIEGDDVEKLVILAERDKGKDTSGDGAAIEAIRAAVTEAHGVVPFDIQIVDYDGVIRSSSGKIARRVNKKAYLGQ